MQGSDNGAITDLNGNSLFWPFIAPNWTSAE
ncbi:hypothetical protein SAMN04487850_2375 [Prevotella aff. ruminicola Tc2-24]|uniref:Uncharacterized protein n=1 Tax=Prevotella aff. ruminicola Tc2-24 TaxID=81582 RepID=A0A1I0QDS3_9BACT|nr:hypothetical protein SAMN04487850_2375 [Prevotella aff. ruminicola Tc2-24]